VLATRAKEINDLKSRIDGEIKHVAELQLVVEKSKMEAASYVKRAEHLTESSQAKIAALESQLRDAEKIGRQMESTVKALQQKLTARVQDFEIQMRKKEELLVRRDAEINDLKSQLKVLTKGINEMSSFFRRAEALADIERQDISKPILNEPVKEGQDRPVAAKSKLPNVNSDAAREIVPREVIECIAGELAEVEGVMKPMALIIVRQHVAALGESIENLPKTRLPELLESLAKDISDENVKIDFRERLARNPQIVGGNGVSS
jgi:hypothetical protein